MANDMKHCLERPRVFLRLIVAVPEMAAGSAVVVFVAGPLGPWAPLVPLAWLALAPLWLTRAGERLAVRLAYRWRPPTSEQAAHLHAAFAIVESHTSMTMSDLDVYAQRRTSDGLNAYAAGRRSIAVTDALVAAIAGGRLTARQAAAVFVHEIGHLHREDTHYGLAIAWLKAPWRIVTAMAGSLLRVIVGKVPAARASLVALGPIVVAIVIVQGTKRHAWTPLLGVIIIGVLLAVSPLVHAALSRSAERSADAYAVRCGLGHDLAMTLQTVITDRRARLLTLHPSCGQRVRDLESARQSRAARLTTR